MYEEDTIRLVSMLSLPCGGGIGDADFGERARDVDQKDDEEVVV